MQFHLFLLPQSPPVVQHLSPPSDKGDRALFALFCAFLHLHRAMLALDADVVMSGRDSWMVDTREGGDSVRTLPT